MPLSEEDKWCGGKVIKHILRQDQNNNGNTAMNCVTDEVENEHSLKRPDMQ